PPRVVTERERRVSATESGHLVHRKAATPEALRGATRSRPALDEGHGLRCSTRQGFIKGGTLHPEGPAERGFAGSRMQGGEDGHQLFGADGLRPSPTCPAASCGLQPGPNPFLRQGAFILRQRPKDPPLTFSPSLPPSNS